jgi:CRISPR type II-A-associated protein Csn2
MKMVFEKFESSIELKPASVNVLRFEDKNLFSRCVYSMQQLFPANCPEPAYFFEDEKELKSKDVLFVVGDVVFFDLNDKSIIAAALKKVSAMFVEDELARNFAAQHNEMIVEVVADMFNQLSGNYDLADDWDSSKYLKAMGFCVDESNINSLADKISQLLYLSADLMPKKVITFVNLMTYLTEEQCASFCQQVKALDLTVLLYEIGESFLSEYFDNGIFVDANYLEYRILPSSAVSCSRELTPFEVLE